MRIIHRRASLASTSKPAAPITRCRRPARRAGAATASGSLDRSPCISPHKIVVRETVAASVTPSGAMSAHLAQLCLRGLSRGPARCRGFAVSGSASASPRTFTAFTIYKGKSALEVKPLGPTLEAAGSGCVGDPRVALPCSRPLQPQGCKRRRLPARDCACNWPQDLCAPARACVAPPSRSCSRSLR